MNEKRILIVDDDRGIQQVLRACLETSGYAVEQATDGAQALESIQRDPPDLVLLDVAMPVLDGMTVLADLRSLLPDGRLRVIVMTAHGSVRVAIQAVRLGAADFLEKPFKPAEVRQSVASVLASEGEVDERASYDAALRSLREALRRGKFIAAEAALTKAGAAVTDDRDPCLMNLAGVLQEAHGRNDSARTYYRHALTLDDSYEPARHNLRRLDQIEDAGATRLEVALGDEPLPAEDGAGGGSPSESAAARVHRLLYGHRPSPAPAH